jgi:hypothetical protein
MAEYNLTAGQHGAYAKTLAAGTTDEVSFEDDLLVVEVFSNGNAALYFTIDGSQPVVRGPGSWELPAGGPVSRTLTVSDRTGANIVVRLVSDGTLQYSVSGTP